MPFFSMPFPYLLFLSPFSFPSPSPMPFHYLISPSLFLFSPPMPFLIFFPPLPLPISFTSPPMPFPYLLPLFYRLPPQKRGRAVFIQNKNRAIKQFLFPFLRLRSPPGRDVVWPASLCMTLRVVRSVCWAATTDLYGKCTKTHSGPRAAPELQDPNLTWRDIQHLTVLTSKRNSLFDAKHRYDWHMNGVGLEFNHLFGFGVLDAGAMVALARDWVTVPPRYHCQAGIYQTPRLVARSWGWFVASSGIRLVEDQRERTIEIKIETDACAWSDTEVNYLEHVQAVITSTPADAATWSSSSSRRWTPSRSCLAVSMILSRRPNDDDSRDGFTKWPFMTTHTWAENPRGTWRLMARLNSETAEEGWIKEWTLMLHGTREEPYAHLPVKDPHSKLAIVKKAHQDKKI
ncbi:PC2-like protein [Penaeus vannamei]|uniref:PC2-like protein n=1 Tax=Penaeus vannamei TaxID=6689 RepID=A0A423S9M3_PENVA|nr:PC2-like protein [Penaeus vannamei]